MTFIRFCIILFIFTSCVNQKDLLHLQKGVKKETISLVNQVVEYKLQPGDIIDIKVSSMDPQSIAIFNKAVGDNVGNQLNEATIFLKGYIVNDSGMVSLPIVGSIIAIGLTVGELKSSVEEKLSPYYKYYSVDVKLMSFRVTILGEVNRQGTYYIYNESSTLLQTLGLAGGLTDLGNNRKIRIIRKSNTKSIVTYVDLSSAELITSEYYYTQPNDVIYVEPLAKAKSFRVNTGAAQLALAALTFVIVILNFIKS